MRERRLDFLIVGLGVGGAETQLARLTTRLQRRGWECRVITMLAPGPLARPIEDAGIPVRSLGMRRGRGDPRAVVRLLRLLRHDPPASLVSFTTPANILGRVAGRLARVPLIVSSFRNERFGSAMRDRLLRSTDALGHINVINSSRAARAVEARGLVRRRGIRVVPNGIVVDELRAPAEAVASVRRALGGTEADGERFVWLTVGRLEPQKDHATLLRAFTAMPAPTDLLWLTGQGPLEPSLREEAAALGVADRVRFLGLRDDVPTLMAAANAFVLSSRWEGSPNVVMEASAAGLPVVATDVGGVAEIVRDGESGILLPPGDPRALAEAMLMMRKAGAGERARMGAAGTAHVRRHFAMDAVTDRWEAVLTEGRLGDRSPGNAPS